MAVMEAERAMSPSNVCQAKTANGDECRARPTADGYCYFHSPQRRTARLEASQKGAEKSATARRARKESLAADLRTASAREILRSAFRTDKEWRAALVDAYREPVVQTDDRKLRRESADALINQIEGKPQQNIQTKTDVTITVVSRLDAALETHADIELPDADVRELEA